MVVEALSPIFTPSFSESAAFSVLDIVLTNNDSRGLYLSVKPTTELFMLDLP